MKITDVRTIVRRLFSLPRIVWVLLFVSFIAGFLLRGGCGGPASERETHIHATDSTEAKIWTCSMHPRIRLPEPGQCPICFMDLIPLTSAATAGSAAELHLSPAAEARAEIATAPVRRGPAEKRVRLSGKVVYDETRYRKITAWTGGRIERIFAAETGMAVKAGDALFELFSPELYSAQEEYLQAVRRRKTGSRESAEMLIGAAAERLVQLGMTRTQVAEIEERGEPGDKVTIFSPISGIVISKNAIEGIYVKQGDPVYTVADLSVLWIKLDAYERDIPWLREGFPVHFRAAALPGRQYAAKVTFISPLVDEKTRTAAVRAAVDNQDGTLKPGMFVTADLHAEIDTRGEPFLLVPATAVLRTGKRAVVYVRSMRGGEAVYTGREVVLGVRADTVYTVVSGLSEGEEVVVRGNFMIDSAMQIEAKPSMMNPAAEPTGSDSGDDIRQSRSEKSAGTGMAALALDPVYTFYLDVQKALVRDRLREARKAAAALHQTIPEELPGVRSKEDGAIWNRIKKVLLTRTEQAENWSEIAAAREAFLHISKAVIELEERFGHSGGQVIYQAFCPMAFDNRGAFWLQDSAVVSNPYYGRMMLRCGELRKTYSGTER